MALISGAADTGLNWIIAKLASDGSDISPKTDDQHRSGRDRHARFERGRDGRCHVFHLVIMDGA